MARLIVPMLQELAARLDDVTIASVRGQVMPGEEVAVYASANDAGRAIICGPSRHYLRPPKYLAADPGGTPWRLIGVVRVTEDGEQSLPVEARC